MAVPSNTMLTPTIITKEALRILHQQCNFITNIVTEYDDKFAKDGAKIGSTLTIRKPNQFPIRTGPTMNAQNLAEPSVVLTVSSQAGVDMNFSGADLTMKLDDFSERYIKPAATRLASHMEQDALSMTKEVANVVSNEGLAATIAKVLATNVKMANSLAPNDGKRYALLQPQTTADLVSAASALFNASDEISRQYKKGTMGQFAGYSFYENTLIPDVTSGSNPTTTAYLVNDSATLSGSTVTIDGGTLSFAVGDTVTIEGLRAVHPETKATLSYLRQFRVTTAGGGGSTLTSLAITPAINCNAGSAYQNCAVITNAAGTLNNATINKIGTASAVLKQDLFFHKSAFCLATADLVMPDGVDWKARQVHDGISMRMIRQYQIADDTWPVRLDVLYGYKTLYNDLACILLNN